VCPEHDIKRLFTHVYVQTSLLMYLKDLHKDSLRATGALAWGVIAGRVIVKGIGKKAATTITAKIIGRNTFEMAAKVILKMAA